MKLAELYPSKYLKAADLEGDTTVVMEGVKTETLKKKDGSEEDKPVLLLNEQKPLVMNVTNANAIASIYGSETDDWIGKEVVLYAVEVTAFGETTEAIRVRNKAWMDKRKAKPGNGTPTNGAGSTGITSPVALLAYLKTNGVEMFATVPDAFKMLKEKDATFKGWPAAADTGAWDTVATALLNIGMGA